MDGVDGVDGVDSDDLSDSFKLSNSSSASRSAIEEGKGIYNNIKNFVRFQLST